MFMENISSMKSAEVLQAEMQKDIEFIRKDVESVKSSIGRMSDSLDDLSKKWTEVVGISHGIVDLNNRINEQDVRMQDHSKRIHDLEILKFKGEGMLKVTIVLTGLVGTVAGMIGAAIIGKFIK